MLSCRGFRRRRKMAAYGMWIASLVVIMPGLLAQAPAPIRLGDLQKTLELGEDDAPTDALIERIRRDGVAFGMTGEAKTAILVSGAKGKRSTEGILGVIQEAEDNCATCPPLSKLDVLGLVLSGLPSARIESSVRWRGVDFECDPRAMRELQNAGAGESLLKVILDDCAARQPEERRPLSREEILQLLAERTSEEEIRGLVRARGVEDIPSDAALVEELRDRGATSSLIALILGVELADGYELLPVAQAPDYNEWVPRGRLDLVAEVDHVTNFHISQSVLSFRVMRGKPPSDAGSQYTQPLPRLPLTMWEWRYKRMKGRSKDVWVSPLDFGGDTPPGLQVVIKDEKGGASLYHLQIEWALKPFTSEWLMDAVRNSKGGPFNDLIRDIRRRGVGFELDADLERSLRAADATDQLISEIRQGRRQSNF